MSRAGRLNIRTRAKLVELTAIAHEPHITITEIARRLDIDWRTAAKLLQLVRDIQQRTEERQSEAPPTRSGNTEEGPFKIVSRNPLRRRK